MEEKLTAIHAWLTLADEKIEGVETKSHAGVLNQFRTEEKITSPNSDLHARVQMLKLFPSRPLVSILLRKGAFSLGLNIFQSNQPNSSRALLIK